MNDRDIKQKELLVVGLTPEFLGKPALWYAQNTGRIKESLETSLSWKNKALILSVGDKTVLAEFLRALDEFGYEKVLNVTRYGEFAHRGGIIDVFPLNLDYPVRIEFAGNYIEEINILEQKSDIERTDWEKILGRAMDARQSDFKEGERVVHLDHGIGIFSGKTELEINEERREYFTIEYAKGDKLFVPITLSRKLSRYLGFSEPAIARLGGTLWLKTKRKVREDALIMAKQLFDIYAAKEAAEREPYQYDILEKEFAATFQYEETPDQARAIKEIMDDLDKNKPSDRLICGDVGFGKTEVALRAMFRVVMGGKQAAILSPTTILADQHYNNAKARFEKFGIKTAFLTRLQSRAEQKKTIKDIHEGKIDVIVGTHRILSKDVFPAEGGSPPKADAPLEHASPGAPAGAGGAGGKKIGLFGVDEEKRFGVKAKETLRSARAHLDVLSLSATPIPRTFYFALAGLRPISRIQTAPEGRQSVETIIMPWKKEVVREVINKELARGGQVYFLHNRIMTIKQSRDEIQKLAPRANIGIIHGRLGEKELIETMHKLRSGQIDILISTTIIENGLDLAHVNTLIVEDASRLGLSQAYQLRGRIGRSHQKAFAYFLWRKKRLSPKATLRLEALEEAAELGSGWRIAERDLEIRGAGNILGREQSGNVNRVGLNLYCQMLSEAVEQIKSSANH